MNPFVRRSLLLVSILDVPAVEASWTHNADAVILDLSDTVPEDAKPAAREQVRESILWAAKGGAEVHVRINRSLAHADLDAAVLPGLTGIVFSGAESASDTAELDSLLTRLEKTRGIPQRSIQIFLLLTTGKGVWNIREIIKASDRVTAVGLDEINLCQNLGIVPNRDFDPFVYAKGRIIVEGRAAKVQPVGISHPYGLFKPSEDADELIRIADHSKNLGFAGIVCPVPVWVEPCNGAFTPTEDQVERYRETRRLFAQGVAQGTAAVPFPGTTMMIDVPVDERARMMLELSELCAARDAEKSAAMKGARLAGPG